MGVLVHEEPCGVQGPIRLEPEQQAVEVSKASTKWHGPQVWGRVCLPKEGRVLSGVGQGWTT